MDTPAFGSAVSYDSGMEIVTAAEMGACDRATSAEYGISLGRLMRAAAEAVERA